MEEEVSDTMMEFLNFFLYIQGMGKVDSHKKEVLSAWAENSHCLGIVKSYSSQKYKQKPWGNSAEI